MARMPFRLRHQLCALACSALGVLALDAAHAQASAPGGMGMQGGAGMHGGAGMDMHGSMMRGMESMRQMQPSGDPDRDFATMMRAHHQQAVEMSQIYLKQAKSPELRKMAQKIISDQQREIAPLDKCLQARK